MPKKNKKRRGQGGLERKGAEGLILRTRESALQSEWSDAAVRYRSSFEFFASAFSKMVFFVSAVDLLKYDESLRLWALVFWGCIDSIVYCFSSYVQKERSKRKFLSYDEARSFFNKKDSGFSDVFSSSFYYFFRFVAFSVFFEVFSALTSYYLKNKSNVLIFNHFEPVFSIPCVKDFFRKEFLAVKEDRIRIDASLSGFDLKYILLSSVDHALTSLNLPSVNCSRYFPEKFLDFEQSYLSEDLFQLDSTLSARKAIKSFDLDGNKSCEGYKDDKDSMARLESFFSGLPDLDKNIKEGWEGCILSASIGISVVLFLSGSFMLPLISFYLVFRCFSHSVGKKVKQLNLNRISSVEIFRGVEHISCYDVSFDERLGIVELCLKKHTPPGNSCEIEPDDFRDDVLNLLRLFFNFVKNDKHLIFLGDLKPGVNSADIFNKIAKILQNRSFIKKNSRVVCAHLSKVFGVEFSIKEDYSEEGIPYCYFSCAYSDSLENVLVKRYGEKVDIHNEGASLFLKAKGSFVSLVQNSQGDERTFFKGRGRKSRRKFENVVSEVCSEPEVEAPKGKTGKAVLPYVAKLKRKIKEFYDIKVKSCFPVSEDCLEGFVKEFYNPCDQVKKSMPGFDGVMRRVAFSREYCKYLFGLLWAEKDVGRKRKVEDEFQKYFTRILTHEEKGLEHKGPLVKCFFTTGDSLFSLFSEEDFNEIYSECEKDPFEYLQSFSSFRKLTDMPGGYECNFNHKNCSAGRIIFSKEEGSALFVADTIHLKHPKKGQLRRERKAVESHGSHAYFRR